MLFRKKKVAKTILEEPDDQPAGYAIYWTILIAIIILAILYFVFFKDR
ncbi:hypothetical protein HMPREF0765_3287 [Sphingobacterium spiritivorum ATCC 33300]|uniref:Uncharacterized protein n=1 Tax=Sphingobacterium spiritivorum ATCC 33300 TaxID=525372 RepID=C2G131_SPHSI|nr:hypothetical protein HMPREF0765_3287 [Sphingobacterium spiritivorum ATCC 33300]